MTPFSRRCWKTCPNSPRQTTRLTRNPLAALIVPVALSRILLRYHPLPYGWAGYLPCNMADWNGLRNVQLINIFGVYLTNFQFGPLLYLALTALLLALCWLAWRYRARRV